LSNTPIIAYVEENKAGDLDFSDHRQIIVEDKNKNKKLKYIGQPIGVIPESNNAQFEFRVCDDGIKREFLTVEGLVWQKWDDPVDIFNRDIVKSQSMEIHDDYEGSFHEDKLFHFTKFSFYGACALGFDVQPAMKNSTIEAIPESQFMKNYLNAKYNQYCAFTKKYFIDDKEGGKTLSLTLNQLKDELRAILKSEKQKDQWGYESNKYWFVDADETKVFVEDTTDSYRLVSFDYSLEGDIVNINFDTKSRVKVVYVPFENGEDVTSVNFTSNDRHTYEINNKEHEVESRFTEQIKEVKELREFQAATLQKEKEVAETELFEKFSTQLNESEIQSIKDDSLNLTLDEIETKLYALVGKKTTKFTAKPKQKEVAKINFSDRHNYSSDKPYAHLFNN